MKIEQFIALLDNPARLTEAHVVPIEKILHNYPYFQSAHLLYAKALHNSKHIQYHQALKKTAVIAGNRAVLYRLINLPLLPEEKKTEDHIVPSIAQIIPEVEPVPEIQKEPEPLVEEKTENPVSSTVNSSSMHITYNLVSEEVPPIAKEKPPVHKEEEEIVPEPEVVPEVEAINTETPLHTETLDEIILHPIVEAYIEKEILKINEKEPEIQIQEPHSFTEWLKQLPTISKQPSVRSKQQAISNEQETTDNKVQIPKQKTEKQALLDKLLKEDMRISKPQADKNFYAATQKTRSSVLEDENLVTETLAKIYVLQGNHGKATRAYEILSLKFPEKSAYFATLIKEIKNNIKQ